MWVLVLHRLVLPFSSSFFLRRPANRMLCLTLLGFNR
jgi:hypothetical protein